MPHCVTEDFVVPHQQAGTGRRGAQQFTMVTSLRTLFRALQFGLEHAEQLVLPFMAADAHLSPS